VCARIRKPCPGAGRQIFQRCRVTVSSSPKSLVVYVPAGSARLFPTHPFPPCDSEDAFLVHMPITRSRRKAAMVGGNDNGTSNGTVPVERSHVEATTSAGSSTSPVNEKEDLHQAHHNSSNDRKPTMEEYMQNLSPWDVFDVTTKPWVLVEDGSFYGYFDWVPRELRVGPWSFSACAYLFVLVYLIALSGVYLRYIEQRPWADAWRTDDTSPHGVGGPDDNPAQFLLEYPAVYSRKWWYHALATLWTLYVVKLIYYGPLSYNAWASYTVQSWSLLTVRHLLCTLAPVYDWALVAAEMIRFPVACSVTVTFCVWNFALAPFCYCVAMKTPTEKRNFLKFVTSFRLIQVHVFNIVFCVANVYWASPRRTLVAMDLYVAILSVLVYMVWYLGVLDRFGIHLYPVFSPRAGPLIIFATWTGMLGMYLGTFFVWRALLQPDSLL
jgi:hypothetical protein